jgi:hypothetical protein
MKSEKSEKMKFGVSRTSFFFSGTSFFLFCVNSANEEFTQKRKNEVGLFSLLHGRALGESGKFRNLP